MNSLEIRDRNALAHIMRELLAEFRTHEATARELGIAQPHFTRLVNGKAGKRLSLRTFYSVERCARNVRPRRKAGKLLAILDRGVVARWQWLELEEYRKWSDEEWTRLADPGTGGAVIWEVIELRNRLRRGVYRHYFTAFERRMQLRGHLAKIDLPDGATDGFIWGRVLLAELRAIAPMLDGRRSGGVERTLEELQASGDLKPYLRAALAREAVLLNRAPDLERKFPTASISTAMTRFVPGTGR